MSTDPLGGPPIGAPNAALEVPPDFQVVVGELIAAAQSMVSRCDGAKTRDEQGFSRADAQEGRVWAYTPPGWWTYEFAEQALGGLERYKNTQLTGMDWPGVSQRLRACRNNPGITPRGNITGLLDYDTAQHRFIVTSKGTCPGVEDALKRVGFRYQAEIEAYVLGAGSVKQPGGDPFATLRAFLLPSKEVDEVATGIVAANYKRACEEEQAAKLAAAARAAEVLKKTRYIEALPDGKTLGVVFPYSPELVNGIKGVVSRGMRRFDGATLPKRWLVQPAGSEANQLLEWAATNQLDVRPEAQAILQALATAQDMPQGAETATSPACRVEASSGSFHVYSIYEMAEWVKIILPRQRKWDSTMKRWVLPQDKMTASMMLFLRDTGDTRTGNKFILMPGVETAIESILGFGAGRQSPKASPLAFVGRGSDLEARPEPNTYWHLQWEEEGRGVVDNIASARTAEEARVVLAETRVQAAQCNPLSAINGLVIRPATAPEVEEFYLPVAAPSKRQLMLKSSSGRPLDPAIVEPTKVLGGYPRTH